MNKETLIQRVMDEVLRQLRQTEKERLLVVGVVDSAVEQLLANHFNVACQADATGAEAYDYVLVRRKDLHQITGVAGQAMPSETCEEHPAPATTPNEVLDMTSSKLIQEKELKRLYKNGIKAVKTGPKTVITPLAADFMRAHHIEVIR